MNKKSITHFQIVLVIISIITLILGIYSFSIIKNNEHQTSVIQCNKFIKSITHNDNTYFEDLQTPNEKFNTVFSKLCPSKKIEIKQNSIENAVILTNNCWEKFGPGEDFLPTYAFDKYCFYCGKITAKKDIKNFKTEFLKIINDNEKYDLFNQNLNVNNLNNITLKNIPKSLKKDETYYIIYNIFLDSSKHSGLGKKILNTNQWLIKIYNKIPGTSIPLKIISDSGLKTNAGILIINKDLDKLKKINCKTYVPEKEY